MSVAIKKENFEVDPELERIEVEMFKPKCKLADRSDVKDQDFYAGKQAVATSNFFLIPRSIDQHINISHNIPKKNFRYNIYKGPIHPYSRTPVRFSGGD